jgi:hypothetical protein
MIKSHPPTFLGTALADDVFLSAAFFAGVFALVALVAVALAVSVFGAGFFVAGAFVDFFVVVAGVLVVVVDLAAVADVFVDLLVVVVGVFVVLVDLFAGFFAEEAAFGLLEAGLALGLLEAGLALGLLAGLFYGKKLTTRAEKKHVKMTHLLRRASFSACRKLHLARGTFG